MNIYVHKTKKKGAHSLFMAPFQTIVIVTVNSQERDDLFLQQISLFSCLFANCAVSLNMLQQK